ncbi:MAG: primosomal protein N' [Clostridia bacterium]|nr:primosomal protein N' [Clostridia bacterium]
MVAVVYLVTSLTSLDREFHYSIPPRFETLISTGCRVKVPFGGGNVQKLAYVTKIIDKSPFNPLKPISAVVDSESVVNEKQLELAMFMRSAYLCTLSEAVAQMIPPGISAKFEEWVSLTSNSFQPELTDKQERMLTFIRNCGKSAEMAQLRSEFGNGTRTIVNALVKKGAVELSHREKRATRDKMVRVAYYSGKEDPAAEAIHLEKKAPAQFRVISFLADGVKAPVADICVQCATSPATLEALYVKGLIAYETVQTFRNPFENKKLCQTRPPTLTGEQKSALDAVERVKEGTILLRGVTGSGKTEVYMRLVQRTVEQGKQAIVLVPEISLTPQITDRFYARFGNVVALIHSALSLGERLDEWKRIRSGEAKVVIGARSAVFAPCQDIGIIIIDEEHEYSYKSESSPRYHAATVAAFRCRQHLCPLVRASATPLVDSYYRAMRGDCVLIEMENRIGNKNLPRVEIADMRAELEAGNNSVLSRALAYEIEKNIERKEQTILLLNRRGYSTFVSCRSCGYVYTCPNCSVSLTYHATNALMTCHMCGHREPKEQFCPHCGSDKIREFGRGTQKAQEQIAKVFPSASIVRMDLDTTGGKMGHEKVLERFSHDRADILLGTQMVAKGLDFPNVTLVGVLAADASLCGDDFRSQERTFALITQVCGRAGRGDVSGRAIIQTYMPENRVLRMAATQDYKAFYNEEIIYREAFTYPPFCNIINITVTSRIALDAQNEAERIAKTVETVCNLHGGSIYGPSEAPITKINGRYRFRVWLKCSSTAPFREALASFAGNIYGDVYTAVDINPFGMN